MSVGGALLDTNVVFGMLLRDTFLRLAAPQLGLYTPYWTRQILAELEENLFEARRMGVNEARQLISILREQFPEAIVHPPTSLVDKMTNHIKDRHVLAAAAFAQAEFLVSFDIGDFGAVDCEPYGVEAITPDHFLRLLYLTSPDDVVVTLIDQIAGYRRDPNTVRGVFDALRRDVPEFIYRVEEDFGPRDLEEELEARREELREQEVER